MLTAFAHRGAWLILLISWGSLILAAGCLTRLAVDRSMRPAVDLNDYQPVAILPPADWPAFPDAGALLRTASREALKAKNFSLTEPEKAEQALQAMNLSAAEISRDAALQRRFGKSLQARIILVPILLDFRSQRSYISSSTTQVWHDGSYEYQSLPTYHQGVCEMKISLKMIDVEKGTVVWAAEGRGRGPSGSKEEILRRLVMDLTDGLPFLPKKRE